MIPPFEFATARRVVFGRGASRQVPALARERGRCALVVLGGSGRGGEALVEGLREAGVIAIVFPVRHEPTTHLVEEASSLAFAERCDLVIAQGGGSVLDAGKAVAGLRTNPGDLLDYLEVVGAGRPLANPGVPFLAIPTTAGTGTEATRNAVLDVPGRGVKVSLRSPHLLPGVAVVDPELTLSLPPGITATTGMDALTQLIEPFVGNAPNPLVDGLCREGLARAARSLRRAYRDGADLDAREDMAVAALFSGMALANAKLGAVHGLAGALGGTTGQAHGAICARLLPLVMAANLDAASLRGRSATLDRYAEVARILTGDPRATPDDGVSWTRELAADLRIPKLAASGLAPADRDAVIAQARLASSMKGNPVELTDGALRGILEAAL
jgi:alcohol dehydrogenase class IV